MGTEVTLEGTTGSVGAFNPTLWAPSCAPLPHRAGEAVPGGERIHLEARTTKAALSVSTKGPPQEGQVGTGAPHGP